MDKFTNEDLKNLEVGQVIYECGYGTNLEAKVLTAPVVEDIEDGKGNIKWQAECTQTGRLIDYAVNENLGAYGLNLYEQPQYVQVVEGVVSYPRMGGEPIKYEDVAAADVANPFDIVKPGQEEAPAPG
ncbi:hypothetical protein [Pseudosulfitobacter pseudonitzschiae]|uniref:hypothetical protein n=1 Tax=Pseudosulfitobacter pseudonitzschiae TaxID=1402135 RepID=UPI003B790925